MFFQSKPTLLVYFKRSSILFFSKAGMGAELPLPEDMVQNLEVLDPVRYAGLLRQFVQSHKIRNHLVLFVLDDELVFYSVADISGGVSPKAALEAFSKMIPFELQNKHAITLTRQQGRLDLFGTNKALYEPCATALLEANCKIYAVVPGVVYGDIGTRALDKTVVSLIIDKAPLAKKADLYTN